MRNVPYHYVHGGAYGQCMRCAFKFRLNQLKIEWSGLRVCGECYDPLPDTMVAPVVYPEGMPRPEASPELPGIWTGAIDTENNSPIMGDDGVLFAPEQPEMVPLPVPVPFYTVTPESLQPPGYAVSNILSEAGVNITAENGSILISEVMRVPDPTPIPFISPEDL